MAFYAVFGNPIKHSKSSKIYSLFANEYGVSSEYSLRLTSSEDFDSMIYNFFKLGGLGANITVPFKERAFFLCNRLTERAILSNSVNTIKKQTDGSLLGDNTDGIGFLRDLKRLNWIGSGNNIIDSIFYKCENVRGFCSSSVLLIGSGGAAKGIIPILLNIKGCYVNLVNRTFSRAQKLVDYYYSIGRQNISCISINNLFDNMCSKKYDLIINATSSSMNNDIPQIPQCLIHRFTKCYDLFYQKDDTSFIKWCKKNGSVYCSDGLGMLVEQAAYSFYLWHGKLPSTNYVLDNIRSMY